RRSTWFAPATVLIVAAIGLRIGVPAYRQMCAIREIESVGGVVEFPLVPPGWLDRTMGRKGRDLFGGIESVRFQRAEATCGRGWSSYAGPAPWTTGPTIDDAKLGCIVHVPNLRRLVLIWTNVGDDGMKHVARLEKLEELNLEGTDVSDAGVALLRRSRNLKK